MRWAWVNTWAPVFLFREDGRAIAFPALGTAYDTATISGRVTFVPVELPGFAVYAVSDPITPAGVRSVNFSGLAVLRSVNFSGLAVPGPSGEFWAYLYGPGLDAEIDDALTRLTLRDVAMREDVAALLQGKVNPGEGKDALSLRPFPFPPSNWTGDAF